MPRDFRALCFYLFDTDLIGKDTVLGKVSVIITFILPELGGRGVSYIKVTVVPCRWEIWREIR